MNGETLYSIGDLARRTGLTVKTIRFYSDRGIVEPTDRNPAGFRLYNIDAAARLDLVRTLRDLGLDLSTIRKVLDRELSLPEVAAAHADALEVQIRTLRLRRAVLTSVAKRGSSPEEMDLMHKLAKLSEDERRHLIDDFLGATLGGGHDASAFAAIGRSLTPELPDNPQPEQVEAWVELAELSQDSGFRAQMRRMADDEAAEQARSSAGGPSRDLVATVRDHAAQALAAGIDPTAPQADQTVAALTAHYANVVGAPDDAELRSRLVARLETASDPRRERYLELLAVINGWPAPESLSPVLSWTVQALRARAPH